MSFQLHNVGYTEDQQTNSSPFPGTAYNTLSTSSFNYPNFPGSNGADTLEVEQDKGENDEERAY